MKKIFNFIVNTLVIVLVVLMVASGNPLIAFGGCLILGAILLTFHNIERWWSIYYETWESIFARVGIK